MGAFDPWGDSPWDFCPMGLLFKWSFCKYRLLSMSQLFESLYSNSYLQLPPIGMTAMIPFSLLCLHNEKYNMQWKQTCELLHEVTTYD